MAQRKAHQTVSVVNANAMVSNGIFMAISMLSLANHRMLAG
jgi:hypothetical protein